MATFETIQNEVVARLGNRSDLGTRSAIWINDAIYELAHNPRFSFRELDSEATSSFAQGDASVVLTDFASDIWFVLQLVDVTEPTQPRRLMQVHMEEITDQHIVEGLPTMYTVYGNTINWRPSWNAAGDFQLLYRKRLPTFSVGEEFPLGREWEEPTTVLAVIKGLEALQRFEEAATHRTIFESILQQRMGHLQLEDPQYETTIGVRFDWFH